jgi:MAF protein
MPGGGEGPRVVLASASPRRRELLGLLGVRFTVVTSRFNEDRLKEQVTDPVEYVRRAAEGKAQDVAARRSGVILGVDTDVVLPDGTILGKPAGPDEAYAMLRSLSGRTHSVYSGIAALASTGDGLQGISRRDVRVVETKVTFADLPDEAIHAYIASKEPFDKAGGYAIQGRAIAFVSRVEGDLTNVIGLPLWPVSEMLSAFGVPLWRP